MVNFLKTQFTLRKIYDNASNIFARQKVRYLEKINIYFQTYFSVISHQDI